MSVPNVYVIVDPTNFNVDATATTSSETSEAKEFSDPRGFVATVGETVKGLWKWLSGPPIPLNRSHFCFYFPNGTLAQRREDANRFVGYLKAK